MTPWESEEGVSSASDEFRSDSDVSITPNSFCDDKKSMRRGSVLPEILK